MEHNEVEHEGSEYLWETISLLQETWLSENLQNINIFFKGEHNLYNSHVRFETQSLMLHFSK